MRISDWSSDVCSSDLIDVQRLDADGAGHVQIRLYASGAGSVDLLRRQFRLPNGIIANGVAEIRPLAIKEVLIAMSVAKLSDVAALKPCGNFLRGSAYILCLVRKLTLDGAIFYNINKRSEW